MDILQAIDVGTNISLIILGLSLLRKFNRMEMKVDIMWARFIRTNRLGNINGD